ncbi:hypothetical protein niasHS_015078 [Heterodera schachtii]|uniref:Uncharacterized protein n=1 Tax=Heterodera schachtii TaxID=97005 RepID=A0ABD2I526_HETSC
MRAKNGDEMNFVNKTKCKVTNAENSDKSLTDTEKRAMNHRKKRRKIQNGTPKNIWRKGSAKNGERMDERTKAIGGITGGKMGNDRRVIGTPNRAETN